MIIRDEGDTRHLIMQTDHAALCGEFAKAWGAPGFSPLVPLASMAKACAEHDNGWYEWEQAPTLNERTGLPVAFYEIGVDDHCALYQRGIHRTHRDDAYAGLLVSRHLSRLYDLKNAHYSGRPVEQRNESEHEKVVRYLDELAEQQRTMLADLREADPDAPHLTDAAVLANSNMLWFYDALSLFMCMRPLREYDFENVPTDDAGAVTSVRFAPVDARTATLDPYPFTTTPSLACPMPARILDPKATYDDEKAMQRAIAEAPPTTIEFVLRALD